MRNLERAGGPRSAAMAMVGHKTEAIYRRYAIVAEADLREAGAKLSALGDHQRGERRRDQRIRDAGPHRREAKETGSMRASVRLA